MARATRHDGIVRDLPEGMKIFTVIGPTIIDSTGAYCTEGQQAALNKKEATHYHKLKLIQVDMPDFDEPKKSLEDLAKQLDGKIAAQEDGDADEPGSDASTEASPAASANRRQARQ